MNLKESNKSYVGGFRLKTYKGGNIVIIILKIFLKNIYFFIAFSFYYLQPEILTLSLLLSPYLELYHI